jgi:CheY-like chemotaxis protein
VRSRNGLLIRPKKKGEDTMSKRCTELDEPKSESRELVGWKIVVADDEPDQLDFLATVFEDHGATIVRATNGDETLAKVREEKPDLLTLDLEMPGRGVGEVFELIRKDPELSELKVCVITGRPELRGLIYQANVRKPEGYLNKPVNEESLLRAVRKCLELVH